MDGRLRELVTDVGAELVLNGRGAAAKALGRWWLTRRANRATRKAKRRIRRERRREARRKRKALERHGRFLP